MRAVHFVWQRDAGLQTDCGNSTYVLIRVVVIYPGVPLSLDIEIKQAMGGYLLHVSTAKLRSSIPDKHLNCRARPCRSNKPFLLDQ